MFTSYSILSASKSPFVCNGKRSLPINFYMAMLWWLYSPNGDLPLCMRQNLRLRLSWSFSYNEAFCLRMDLVCSIAIVVGCSCLPSSTDRSSLRSRFSFGLSWSICSCDTLHAERYIACWFTIVYNGTRHGNVLCIGDGFRKWLYHTMLLPCSYVLFWNTDFFEATIFPMQR